MNMKAKGQDSVKLMAFAVLTQPVLVLSTDRTSW